MQTIKYTRQGIIRRFGDFLPQVEEDSIVSLNEGNTPLLESRHIVSLLVNKVRLFFKYEGLNPTGSFKDRGMTMAVSKAKEAGSKAIICASTGNTSASTAAYAARSGMKAYVLIPKGKIALGKLSQAMICGAKVVQIRGNFDDALNIVREVADNYPVTIVNSINPYRIEGQKTAAFEICESIKGAPAYHFLPVGNAGNITAYWKGYKEFHDKGIISNLPKMMGFQAQGAAPIVMGHPIKKPKTIATAIRIGNPANWDGAIKARDESGGVIETITDDEIIAAYKLLARHEGIFCEPASAASLAGLLKMRKEEIFKSGETVVCTLTGHGLKDPDIAIKSSERPITVEPIVEKIIEVLDI